MRKQGNVIVEQPFVMILIIIAALLVLWGVMRAITIARERGLSGIFGS